MAELIDHFWQHAKCYYRNPDGSSSKELQNFRLALRPLQDLYGNSRAAEFGPRKLKAARQDLINGGATKRRNPEMDVRGGSRMYVNKQIRRVKLIFKWAVAEELIPPAVYQSLQAVKGLKRGRCEVRETDPIKPVRQEYVDAIEPYVSAQVWALVQLQLLTGARAGELVLIRAIDIDTSGKICSYSPVNHKTAHHGHFRTIYLGPRTQRVLQPFLAGRSVDAYLFPPIEAEAEWRQRLNEPSWRMMW